MDKFLTIDANTDKTLEHIIEIAANFSKFLESSIISKKHDILNLILSNYETDEKKEVNSITKPFNKLFKTPETDKWCAILCNYRANFYDDYRYAFTKN